MKLTIFGATGPTGRRLLERALAEGHEVTAFARSASKLNVSHERLRIAAGDVFDAGQVEEAVAGQEAVISVLGGKPSNPLKPSRTGDPNGPGSGGARNIIRAMNEHGLRRFICQTAWGTAESKQDPDLPGSVFLNVLIPVFLRDDYADKEEQERIVRSCGLDWTIVRPMALTNGPWTGNYRVGEHLKPGRKFRISRADVVHFLLRQLDTDRYLRKTPAIGY